MLPSLFSSYPYVIVESPYAGEISRNIAYASACVLDCFNRGEVPFASHLLYTQMLSDTNPEQRRIGIEANLKWIQLVRKIAVYTDLGISSGMQEAVDFATRIGANIEYRNLVAEAPLTRPGAS